MSEPYEYLAEDLGDGDATSEAVIQNQEARAIIIAKEDSILAGLEEAVRIFEHEGLRASPRANDGQQVRNGATILEISGFAKQILKVERLTLNFICKMSGIATETRALVDRCRQINPNVQISATRKTTPGFRQYEKKAVILGGGVSHRQGLWDMILIKDNHLKIVGSITKAVALAKTSGSGKKVEVEVVDMDGAIEAAKAHPDRIMLDNFTPDTGALAAAKIREINPKIEIEISGGITPDNITQYAKFADVISLGWLTHSAKAANFSLEIDEVF